MFREKLRLLAEKFSEAWTACMLCMVQGDLTILTLNHAYTASKTGLVAGIAIVLASYWKKINNKYYPRNSLTPVPIKNTPNAPYIIL